MDDKMNGKNQIEKELEQVAGGSGQCPKDLSWMDPDLCQGCIHCCLGNDNNHYRCDVGVRGFILMGDVSHFV